MRKGRKHVICEMPTDAARLRSVARNLDPLSEQHPRINILAAFRVFALISRVHETQPLTTCGNILLQNNGINSIKQLRTTGCAQLVPRPLQTAMVRPPQHALDAGRGGQPPVHWQEIPQTHIHQLLSLPWVVMHGAITSCATNRSRAFEISTVSVDTTQRSADFNWARASSTGVQSTPGGKAKQPFLVVVV